MSRSIVFLDTIRSLAECTFSIGEVDDVILNVAAVLIVTGSLVCWRLIAARKHFQDELVMIHAGMTRQEVIDRLGASRIQETLLRTTARLRSGLGVRGAI